MCTYTFSIIQVNHLDRLGSDEYVSSPKHSPKQVRVFVCVCAMLCKVCNVRVCARAHASAFLTDTSAAQTAMSPPPRSPTGHKGKGGGAFFSDDPMRFSTLSPPNSDAGKSHPMDTSLSPEATEHPVHHMHALHPHVSSCVCVGVTFRHIQCSVSFTYVCASVVKLIFSAHKT